MAGFTCRDPFRPADDGAVFNVPFPMTPYPQQRDFMGAARGALEQGNGCVCVLESPTGTGKTQSLLNAVLSWLRQESLKQCELRQSPLRAVAVVARRRVREDGLDQKLDAALQRGPPRGLVRQRAPPVPAADTWDTGDDAEFLVAEPVTDGAAPLYDMSLSDTDDDPAPAGKTSGVLSHDEEYAELALQVRGEPRLPRVFYMARTHSQLSQVLEEARRTAFWTADKPDDEGAVGNAPWRLRAVHLGSRQQLCANDEVKRQAGGSASRLNDLCLEAQGVSGKPSEKEKRDARERRKQEARRRRAGLMRQEDGAGDIEDAGGKCAGCRYAERSRIEALADRLLLEPHTQEAAVAAAKAVGGCAFYASRMVARYCNLVLMPYGFVADPALRRSVLAPALREADPELVSGAGGKGPKGQAYGAGAEDIDVEGDVLVFDEGHNVAAAVENAVSATVPVRDVLLTTAVLRRYLLRYGGRLGLATKQRLSSCAQALRKIARFIARASDGPRGASGDLRAGGGVHRRWGVTAFTFEADIDNFNFFDVSAFFNHPSVAAKIAAFGEQELRRRDPNVPADFDGDAELAERFRTANAESSVVAIRNSLGVCDLLASADEATCVVAAVDESSTVDEAWVRCIAVVAVAPGDALASVSRSARATLLAGGTMQPFDILVQQLFPTYKLATSAPEVTLSAGPWVVPFVFGHVVPKENFVVRTLGVGPRGHELRFTHALRDQRGAMLDEAAAAVLTLCRVVPMGVVVFFTSYDMEQLFYDAARRTSVADQLGRFKRIFREERGGNHDDLLQRYSAYIKALGAAAGTGAAPAFPRPGAVLTAVLGGKLSEGINFADDMARAVIVVGLPYPNPQDPKLQLTMDFLSGKHPSGEGRSDARANTAERARRYYDALCMRAVNQGIGRCLRHAADHAAIVLLDSRYKSSAVAQQLPHWAMPRIGHCSGSFGDTLAAIRTFFADVSSKP